jgi:predicted Zn-dependent protease
MRKINLMLYVFLCGCVGVSTGPGRRERILIPTPVEVSIGRGAAQDVERKLKLLNDAVVQNYVKNVGNRIVRIVDRRDIKYYFKVIDAPQINAFALPGGWVYIYTGLLKQLNNEAQLAAVLAHEIAHIVARHGVKRLQLALGGSLIAGLIARDSKTIAKASKIVLSLVMKGYSRKDEFEADKFGTYYLAKTGYNPRGMIEVLEILKSLEGRTPSKLETLFRTHPPTKDRIKKVNSQINGLNFKQSISNNEEVYKEKVKSRV